MRFLRLGIIFACGLAFSVHAEDLFFPTAIKTAQSAAGLQVDVSKRSRLVTLNLGQRFGQNNWAPSSTIDFNLFDDARLRGELERVSGPGEGRSILRGHIKGIPGSYFLLACESNIIAGTIFAPGKGAYRIQYAGQGLHRVLEMDPGERPRCGNQSATDPVLPSAEPPATQSAQAVTTGKTLTVVDVLVLYTEAARDGAGGALGISTLIDLSVAEANLAYENSQVNLFLRLAQKAKVSYHESGDVRWDFARMINLSDGYLDDIAARRASANADLVCLLVENSQEFAGVARQTATATNGFSVVQRAYAAGYQIFAHELAHNFGCQHNVEDATSPGVYSYSYGWHFDAGFSTYGTVMSYIGSRIPFFSNPSVSYQGVPTGNSSANNAQTLSLRMTTVSAFSGAAATTETPTVDFIAPTNGSFFFVGDNVLLKASATTPSGVSGIEFYQNGTLVGSGPGPTFSCWVTNLAYGDAAFTAKGINALGAATVSTPAVVVHARYRNDQFASGQAFTGTNVVVDFCNWGATLETGEIPAMPHGAATVWFTWQAPTTGRTLFEVPGHSFAGFAAVYTGEVLTNLQLVASSSLEPVWFDFEQDVTYQIVIGGYDNSQTEGCGTLTWQAHARPLNDHLSDAITIPGDVFHTTANNVGCTVEPGEPSHYSSAQGHSVWWRWTASTNGELRVSATGPMVLAAYIGAGGVNLTRVVPSAGSLRFNVVAGTTYWLAADNFAGHYSVFDLDLYFSPTTSSLPPNDDFAARVALEGSNLSFVGTTMGATRELGEPWDFGPATAATGQSVWWSWTAPSTCRMSLQAETNSAVFEVFTGSSLTNLTKVGDTSVNATAGTTYHIRLDSSGQPLMGVIQLETVPRLIDLTNDSFAGRRVLSGSSVAVIQSNAGATKEAGEPNHGNNPGGQSVWYTWTSPFNGRVRFRVEGGWQLFYPLLGVYRGTALNALQPLGQSAFGYPSFAPPEVVLPVTNGTTVQMAVDGYNGFFGMGAVGEFALVITGPPTNDNFAAAWPLVGTNLSIKASNYLGTKQPGEPHHGFYPGGSSVWFSWTPPTNGTLRLGVISSFARLVGIYTGSALGNLQPVFSTFNPLTDIDLTGGTTYYVAVDDSAGIGGDFTLNLAFTPLVPRPVNDNFANRTRLYTLDEIHTDNTNATREFGEPNHLNWNGSKSLWWELTPPVTGRINVNVAGGIVPIVMVYSGTQLTNLIALASTEFDAASGEKYQIVVDAFDQNGDPGYGDIHLTFSVQLAPTNDNFAARSLLSGTSVTVPVTSVGASRENGEPVHGASGRHSVWYSWTAPADGTLVVRTFASEFSTLIAAYHGNQLTNLVKLMESVGGYNAKGFVPVSAGETYQIAADTFDDQFGDFTLSLEFLPPPTNDMFAQRLPLSGNFIHLSASNIGATREPGEVGDFFPGASIPGTNSVWWTWTATTTGTLTISGGGDFSAFLSLYTGATVNALEALPRTIPWPGITTFEVQAGTTYQISLDGYAEGGDGIVGSVEYDLWMSGPPPNDNFADRQLFSGLNSPQHGFNSFATAEFNEPQPHAAAAGKSVWYSWVAPAAGRYAVSAEASSFGTESLVAVYHGSALTNLVLLAHSGPPGATSFRAEAGVAYAIAVDTTNADAVGLVQLVIRPVPLNDGFADRFAFSGTNVTIAATNSGATKEPGELIGGDGRTLWWSWTAPVSGRVTITPPPYDLWIQVFEGNSISNLLFLAAGNWAFGFTAIAGQAYEISADSMFGLTELGFSLTLDPAPVNDNWAAATSLSGLLVQTNGDNIGATIESGEPRFPDTNSSATIWWSWTAPETRSMTIRTGFDVYFAAYTGSSVSNLDLVVRGTNAGSFTAIAGVTYFFAADASGGALGNIDLWLSPTPANDLFANRRPLNGFSVSLRDSNRGALMEPGEMGHAVDPSGASVWFTWTAPASGLTTITYGGDVFFPAIVVYTGTDLSNLVGVAGNGFNHPFSFTATAGVTYQIAVAGYYAGEGDYFFNLWLNGGKTNDLFAQRIALAGTNMIVAGNNTGATIESGEPTPGGVPASHSLWWSWMAPTDGNVALDVSGTSFNSLVRIYRGGSLSTLQVVTNVPEYFSPQLFFNVVAGTNYLISFDGYNGATGDIQFEVEFRPAPANDHFTNRLVLSPGTTEVNADNRGATTEPGEPMHAGFAGAHSLWWSWTAVGSNPVTLKVTSQRLTPRMAVYRGATLNTLILVSSNLVGGLLSDALTFTPQPGTNYQIALDSAFTEFGPLSLTMNSYPRPPNDKVANAIAVSALAASVTGATVGATFEPGEPAHAGFSAHHSIWWKWTASVDGPVSVDTLGSSFDTVLAVYTGSAVNNLSPVIWNDDAPAPGGSSRVDFVAAAGVTYLLAVDGFGNSSGEVQLNVQGTIPEAIRFIGLSQLQDGRLALSLAGTPTGLFVLETSTNLVEWQPVLTNQFTSPTHQVLQPANLETPVQFYRARLWP